MAVEFFRKAIDAKPDEIRHYLWLGKTYMELDREDSARKILEKALELPPADDGDRLLQKEARELLDDL
jgi:FimV-like protein